MIEALTYAFTALLTLAIPGWYLARHLSHTRTAKGKLQRATERGMSEPVSLHPLIDPTRCIGTAACVSACPEGEILGLVDGKAALVSPSKCIGHGACEASCPVDAIKLVFGTESRGVDIPFVQETFETNVPGVYIAGELGGMGLIRNAVTQGREAAEYIRESLNGGRADGVFDLAVVGAGPAGLAASLQAQKDRLRFVTLDQEDIGGTILTFPRQKLVMTQPMEIPLYGQVKFREVLKEEILGLWQDIIQKTGLEVQTREKVESVEPGDDFFRVVSTKSEYRARRVLLTIGRRGTPRKLGVPGEKSSKVAYRLLEPEQYANQKALVVGGGDSAVEAALALSEQPGTEVHLSYRKNAFSRIKEKNEERIHQAISDGRVQALFESHVQEIRPNEVLLTQGEQSMTLANDQVFVFIGGILPTEFLKSIGISIEKKFGER